jgi:hypothetical protein
MALRFWLGLLLLTGSALAQPVSFTATASFSLPTVLGSGPNTVTASFVPLGRQTLNPTTNSFDFGRFIQLRLEVTGNLMAVTLPETYTNPFTLTIVPENSQRTATLTGTLRLAYAFPRRYLIIEFDQTPSAVDGVVYSWLGASVELVDFGLPAPHTSLYDLLGRSTRATLRFQPASVRIVANAGEVASQQVAVNNSMGTPISAGGANEYISTLVESPATIRVQVLHGLLAPANLSAVVPVSASGLQTAYLPVDLVLQPGDKFLSVNPKDLRFVYTRGQPPPASQQSIVLSSDAVTLVPNTWDSSWLSPALGNGFVNFLPLLANKNTGAHRTHAVLQNASRQQTSVYANFIVNDGPGALNLTTQPVLGGVVLSNVSAPENGARVILTATAQPGFVFGRWSGAVNDTANPVSVVVNGPTNVTALFLPVTGSCTYTLKPNKVDEQLSGGGGKVEILTQSGCPWSISDLPAWMQLTSPGAGNGPGFFTYTISSNASGTFFAPQREAFLRVGDRILMVEQASERCGYFLPSIPPAVPASGGVAPVLVRATLGCPYTPVATQPWMTLPAAEGPQLIGQQFGVTLQTNAAGQPRTGAVTMAGYRIPVIQRAANPVAPYLDVSPDNVFADHITILKTNNAATTCAPELFCPNAPAVRSDMAEMLVRAIVGGTFEFPAAPQFLDVPANHPQFKWIQKLAELGITNGCAAQRFCPGDTMTRGQMAAFLIRAKTGVLAGQPSVLRSAYNPFVDVERTSIFASPIWQLRVLGITTGCYENAFCPDDFVTRGQMAAFLVRAFFTP